MTNNHDKVHGAPDANQPFVVRIHHQNDAHHVNRATQPQGLLNK